MLCHHVVCPIPHLPTEFRPSSPKCPKEGSPELWVSDGVSCGVALGPSGPQTHECPQSILAGGQGRLMWLLGDIPRQDRSKKKPAPHVLRTNPMKTKIENRAEPIKPSSPTNSYTERNISNRSPPPQPRLPCQSKRSAGLKLRVAQAWTGYILYKYIF